MGSPNFYTNVEGVNFAVEFEEDVMSIDDFNELHVFATELVETLNNSTFFHLVKLQNGYHSGFQLYIQDELLVDEACETWAKYGEFYDIHGNSHNLEDCPYFRPDAKNVTHYSLIAARKRERSALTNKLTAFAREHSMGQVVGKSWTSSVSYDW